MSDFSFPFLDEFGIDEREKSLAEFLMRLQFIKPKVEIEFIDSFVSWKEVQSLRDALQAELAAMHADAVNGVSIYTPGFAAAEIREQSALLRAESAAGSLVLMLDDITQRLRQSVWDTTTMGPKAPDFALGPLPKTSGHTTTLIYASGNAYRHSRDWKGLIREDDSVNDEHEQYPRAKASLAILEPIIGLAAIPSNMTCILSVAALSLDNSGRITFEALWDEAISSIAPDFARQFCKQQNAFERVTEALEYQEAIGSMEVSYSGDNRLFQTFD